MIAEKDFLWEVVASRKKKVLGKWCCQKPTSRSPRMKTTGAKSRRRWLLVKNDRHRVPLIEAVV